MLKFAVIADVHLSYLEDTVQYKALEFACNSIMKSNANVVICIGDATAYGEIKPAEYFLRTMEALRLPQLRILGNSDMRTRENRRQMDILKTKKELKVSGYRFIGIDTAMEEISEEDFQLLDTSDENTIVFMHHPYCCLKEESAERVKQFLQVGNYKAFICGHLHYYEKQGKVYLVQALDPDKAIGEPPCVTYFTIDDEGNILVEHDYFEGKMPEELDKYLGLSCFQPEVDIPYAIEHSLRNLELRPSAVYFDREKLLDLIAEWRRKGGQYLSLHMPDFGYKEGIIGEKEWKDAISCANELCVDGVTVHVPLVSLQEMKAVAQPILLTFITQRIRELADTCKVGIENMI